MRWGQGLSATTQPTPERRRWARLSLAIPVFVRGINGQGREFLEFCTLLNESASALWQKGAHIQAFSAQLQEGQETFHLAVDKAAVAKQTFIENGWKATEETALAQT